MRLYWDTLEMNQKGSNYLQQTELNSSKIIQINPSGIPAQSRTYQIMHQEGLMFVMTIKLKGGILDHSFFGNQRQFGMTTK